MATKKDQGQKKTKSKKSASSTKKGAAVSKKRPAARTAKSAAGELPKRAPSPFVVKGQILTAEGKPASGLRVAAYDRDVDGETWLGEVVTGSDGRYSIAFDEKTFRRTSFESGGPDILVRLFNDKGERIFQSAAINNAGKDQRIDIKLEPKVFTVRGKVCYADGEIIPGLIVKAFDKDLRNEQLLGQSSRSNDGSYQINYSETQFRNSEKGSADLLIRACIGSKVLAESPIKFNAKATEVIDLQISKPSEQIPSEYQTVLDTITPLLDGARLEELTDEDISFLVNDTNVDKARIAALSKAAKLATVIDIKQEVLYGLARKGVPIEGSDELLSRPLSQIEQVLEDARKENLISRRKGLNSASPVQFDPAIAKLKEKLVDKAYQAPANGGCSLTDLLRTCTVFHENIPDKQSIKGRKLNKLLEFFATYQKKAEDIWIELADDPEFNDQDIQDIRLTFQFGTLTRNHLPLVMAFQDWRKKPLEGISQHPLPEIRELARLSKKDWLKVIKSSPGGNPIGYPLDTPGETDKEKAENYAEHLFRQMEMAFPTKSIAYQIKEAGNQIKEGNKKTWSFANALFDFLVEHQDFDLSVTRIEPYLIKKQGEVKNIVDDAHVDEFKHELQALQRLFHLAPRFDRINEMKKLGFSSARGISRLSKKSFVEKYSTVLGGKQQAALIHETAAQRAAKATLIWSKYGWDLNKWTPWVIPTPGKPEDFENEIPNWTQLFGSPDFCECKECNSVHGPAAYLVDILQFLQPEPNLDRVINSGSNKTPDKSAFDILIERRPDLEQINLSCKNTNTSLPYVDLVNEILERKVSQAVISTGNWPQTTWTTGELAANPEHVYWLAYEGNNSLYDNVYPWNLPFDLNAEEARAYLQHLGVPRYKLMEVFKKDHNAIYSDPEIAREYLGITKVEWELLAGKSHCNEQEWPKLWGLSENAAENKIHNPYGEEITDQNWNVLLHNCWLLLKRSGLTLNELLGLLQLSFVYPDNPDARIKVHGLAEGKLQCVMLEFPEGGDKIALKRICLFVRLQRKLGWAASELDQALTTFNKKEIDEDFLLKVSHIKRLREQLRVPLSEMLCWWGNIPTTSECEELPPLFVSLFLNNSVIPREASKEEWITFGRLIDVPNPSTPLPISNYLPRLTAALGVSSEDILSLIGGAGSDHDQLTLSNLSYLYRRISLCKALRLSVREFVVLMGLIESPFSDDNSQQPSCNPTEKLLRFVIEVQKLRGSGFKVFELDYWLRHRFESPANEEAELREQTIILEQLRAGLRKVSEEHVTNPDPTDVLVHQSLGALGWDTSVITQTVATLNSAEIYTLPLERLPKGLKIPSQLSHKLSYDSTPSELNILGQKLRCVGVLTSVERDILLNLTCSPIDSEYKREVFDPAITKIFDAPRIFLLNLTPTFINNNDLVAMFDHEKKTTDRFGYYLGKLNSYLCAIVSESFVKERLTQTLKLEPAIAEALLTYWVKDSNSDNGLKVFLNQDFINSKTLLQETFIGLRDAKPDHISQYETLTKLMKIATILSRLNLDLKATRYLFENKVSGWLDLNALPVKETQSNTLYSGWSKMIAMCKLRDRIGATTPDLLDLFIMAQRIGKSSAKQKEFEDELYGFITKRLGWDFEDFTRLKDKEHLGLKYADFRNELAFFRMEECFQLARRLGVAVTKPVEITTWAGNTVNGEISRSIKQSVKAKYDEKQWLVVSKPLQDVLREKKRQALVSYLCGLWDWTPDQLYGYFLIDVEMQPCMMTSRIKQAISSVQLFIQRCLLGLEKDVAIKTDGSRWWDRWMKNYRIWEANRKIFLYPENWIEPELRDDKSPFFKELENELLQGEITSEFVEKAYLNYLEKLDRVSNLEIVAQYHDSEGERFYIFGRTPNTPHVYFFRYQNGYNLWSPWEKIDLDIEGDHLIPVIWNRRLHLFWPIFKEVSKKAAGGGIDSPYGEASKTWDIKIAWSEYRDGKWFSKKITQKPIKPKGQIGKIGGFGEVLDIPAVEDERIVVVGQHIPYYLGDKKNAGWFYFQPIATGADLRLKIFYVDNAINQDDNKFWICPNGSFYPCGEFHFAENKGTPTQSEYEITDKISLPNVDYSYVPGLPLQAKKSVIDFTAITKNEMDRYISGGSYIRLNSSLYFWNLTVETEFRLLFANNRDVGCGYSWFSPFFYQDHSKTLLVLPKFLGEPLLSNESLNLHLNQLSKDNPLYYLIIALPTYMASLFNPTPFLKYKLIKHYHPFTAVFIKEIERFGIDGLLNPKRGIENSSTLFRQDLTNEIFDGSPYRKSDSSPIEEYPREEISFEEDDAYSCYNWELFFHIPLLIADRLSQNQRFEEAHKWFHYIFNPTEMVEKDDPARGAWRLGKFFDLADDIQSIEKLMEDLNGGKDKNKIEAQVKRWRDNPFQPHLIARGREGMPYMKTVVMKYIDNLIAWADTLFRRDTIESVNEATQLYILAATILGPRPQQLPPLERADETYSSIKDRLDVFSNVSVAIENDMVQYALSESDEESVRQKLLPSMTYSNLTNPNKWNSMSSVRSMMQLVTRTSTVFQNAPSFSVEGPLSTYTNEQDGSNTELSNSEESNSGIPSLYFCIPGNSKLMSYWDIVADRLFKIRHCMNIEGVVRQLPLFEPPIEPGLLVKAAAAGIDFSTILNDISVALPHYRFSVMLQKANELCADVKALGAALLAAVEKRDAEELALLRSGHEKRLLDAVGEIKGRQIEEADASIKALERSKELAELRLNHYSSLEFMNSAEKQQLDLMAFGMISQLYGSFLQMAASTAHASPQVKAGYACMGGVAEVEHGGEQVAKGLEAFAWYLNSIASMLNVAATQSSIMGGYKRRQEEWTLQKNSAAKDIQQIEKQITSAEIRLAIAEKDKENHRLQIEQAAETDEYMRSKFTNVELYNWMISQISAIYFQSYQMAFDLAKRAEKCFRFELGLQGSNYINFGYWDSLKKGLLAGEKLQYDLRRLELAYLDQNRREFEITKSISLALLDPIALITLKQSGECNVSLPEALFDLDCPGHYMRRIKSVSLTIPCVTGPYTSVNCRLSQLKSSVRNSMDGTTYVRNIDGEDPRFTDNYGAIQSIVTSTAQNDSGLFELNFRDERYLPFEGSGVISDWRIELPSAFPQFDYETISDVIIHLRYTARDGGDQLKLKSQEAVNEFIGSQSQIGLAQAFSLKHDFSSEWNHFLTISDENGIHEQTFTFTKNQFPFLFNGRTITIKNAHVIAVPKAGKDASLPEVADKQFKEGMPIGQLSHKVTAEWTQDLIEETDKFYWTLNGRNDTLESLEDILIVFNYTVG